jgi:prevent-host-death family protein
MAGRWQLQDAKNRFSEVVEKALKEGPQTVTRRGTDAVVVISAGHYHRLIGRKKGLVDFLRKSPLVGVDLDIERSLESAREVDL